MNSSTQLWLVSVSLVLAILSLGLAAAALGSRGLVWSNAGRYAYMDQGIRVQGELDVEARSKDGVASLSWDKGRWQVAYSRSEEQSVIFQNRVQTAVVRNASIHIGATLPPVDDFGGSEAILSVEDQLVVSHDGDGASMMRLRSTKNGLEIEKFGDEDKAWARVVLVAPNGAVSIPETAVSESVAVASTLSVGGNAVVDGRLDAKGDVRVTGSVRVDGMLEAQALRVSQQVEFAAGFRTNGGIVLSEGNDVFVDGQPLRQVLGAISGSGDDELLQFMQQVQRESSVDATGQISTVGVGVPITAPSITTSVLETQGIVGPSSVETARLVAGGGSVVRGLVTGQTRIVYGDQKQPVGVTTPCAAVGGGLVRSGPPPVSELPQDASNDIVFICQRVAGIEHTAR